MTDSLTLSVPPPPLSILCVTRGEPCVHPCLRKMAHDAAAVGAEFVLVLDVTGEDHRSVIDLHRTGWLGDSRLTLLTSAGYIESVLDTALGFTTGRYVLRLDDDEELSPSPRAWLKSGAYRDHPHWKFPRVHLGPNDTFYSTPPLWRDHQTRLSVRNMAGGRNTIHCGSPYGGGHLAPVPILHHKFLLKTLDQRREIVARYNRVAKGMGDAFSVFSTPEDVPGFDPGLRPLAEAYQEAAKDAAEFDTMSRRDDQ